MSNRFRAVNKLQKIRRNGFDKLKPPWPTIRNGKARRRFRRGLYDICDDANVRLICPTRQVAKATRFSTATSKTKSLGRGWRNLRPNRAQGGCRMFYVAAVL